MKFGYLTLSDFLSVLRRRLFVILGVALLCGAVLLSLAALRPEKYGTKSSFYVRTMQSEAVLRENGMTSSQMAVLQNLAKEYAGLATESDGYLDAVLARLEASLSREELRAMLSAESEGNRIILTVCGEDKPLVAAVATAAEAEFAGYINSTAWPGVTDAECVIAERGAGEPAVVSAAPFSMGFAGFGIGFAAAYLFCLLLFVFGNRLYRPEEISRILPEYSLIGDIPCEKGAKPDNVF